MQTTGGFHDQVIKAFSHVTENIVHDTKDFDAANAVLYPDAFFRDLPVLFFLLYAQLLSFWFFGRLVSGGVFGLIALEACVFPKFAPFWKRNILLIGQFLVVLFSFTGFTQNFDLARSFVAHHIVLDRMPFLLSAVM